MAPLRLVAVAAMLAVAASQLTIGGTVIDGNGIRQMTPEEKAHFDKDMADSKAKMERSKAETADAKADMDASKSSFDKMRADMEKLKADMEKRKAEMAKHKMLSVETSYLKAKAFQESAHDSIVRAAAASKVALQSLHAAEERLKTLVINGDGINVRETSQAELDEAAKAKAELEADRAATEKMRLEIQAQAQKLYHNQPPSVLQARINSASSKLMEAKTLLAEARVANVGSARQVENSKVRAAEPERKTANMLLAVQENTVASEAALKGKVMLRELEAELAGLKAPGVVDDLSAEQLAEVNAQLQSLRSIFNQIKNERTEAEAEKGALQVRLADVLQTFSSSLKAGLDNVLRLVGVNFKAASAKLRGSK